MILSTLFIPKIRRNKSRLVVCFFFEFLFRKEYNLSISKARDWPSDVANTLVVGPFPKHRLLQLLQNCSLLIEILVLFSVNFQLWIIPFLKSKIENLMIFCKFEQKIAFYTAELSKKWIKNVLRACEPFGVDKLPVASMLVI